MKHLLLSIFLGLAVSAPATPMIAPPKRKIWVTSIGDVLEHQPGLGIVVLSKRRTVTRVSKRRVTTSSAKTIIPFERSRRPAELEDEGDRLMHDVEPVE